MFVGHEFLAFAIAVAIARLVGADECAAVTIGLLAGASAFLPDLDLVVGAVTYAGGVVAPASASWDSLWGVANGIHRGVSHTLIGGLGTAVTVTATAVGSRRAAGTIAGSPLVPVAVGGGTVVALLAFAAGAGPGEVASIALVAVGAVAVGAAVGRATALSPEAVLGGAAVGVFTHPFGDLFMAAPPQFLYPVAHLFPAAPVRLVADPTGNLLAITGVELAAVWLGVLAYASLTETDLWSAVSPLAGVGLGYPLLMAFVPRPTMVDAHWLGFTIAPFAAVGLVAAADSHGLTRERALRAVVSGLVTVTVAAVAYSIAYLLLSPR